MDKIERHQVLAFRRSMGHEVEPVDSAKCRGSGEEVFHQVMVRRPSRVLLIAFSERMLQVIDGGIREEISKIHP